MPTLTRRRFSSALLASIGLAAMNSPRPARARSRTIVIGGGPAGATAAHTLRRHKPAVDILLIERDPARLSSRREQAAPFSRPRTELDLEDLRAAHIDVVLDDVVDVDWRAGRLELFSGRALAFDRLLVAPGTAAVPEPIPGLDAAARHRWPAAWGNTRDARRLAAQLSALPEDGHVVLRVPSGPLSHPDAVLARIGALAGHTALRPGGRLTVLNGSSDPDLAQRFSRTRPMRTTTDHIAWFGASEGGTVHRIDASRGIIETNAGPVYADVVNFIVPRAAGRIAHIAGLTDHTGWCPCDPGSRSTLRPEAIVIGDAQKNAMRTVRSVSAVAKASVARG
ncbi:MAG: FAD-dependent oxidoreductase [Pseudomonadota bacterium]